jgi:SNF2 family DNA or RNA helicase
METVWAKAIFGNFLSHRRTEILYGSAERRLAKLRSDADFFVLNFDGVGVGARTGNKGIVLEGFSKVLAERADIRMVIVDEASAYKDAQTKRHRIARMVIGKRDHLILMTGTPTPNRPSDAYGLTKMVNNAWGKSFTTFRSECEVQVSPYIWKPRTDGYQYARKFLSPSIRFDIQDIWDGPELTTQQREVDLTTQQKKLMADLKRDLQIEIKSGQRISALNEASARLKFIQISLGAVYDQDHLAHRVDAAPRLEELKAVIREAPAKLLIFVPLTSVVNLLYKELTTKVDAHGKTREHWTAEIINGQTHPKDRSRIFQAFQNEADPRILIADPAAMAHGLDLWAARTVVWYAPIDKTELYLQANKRAHRPGQKFPVTIVQLVSNLLEKEIFRRLDHNETMQGVLLDMIKKGEL